MSAECGRRLTENKTAIADAAQSGERIRPFECHTRCVTPDDLQAPGSRARDAAGLRREADQLAAGAASAGQAASEADGTVCRTDTHEIPRERPRDRMSSLFDSVLPARSTLRGGSTQTAPEPTAEEPAPASLDAAPAPAPRRSPFLPMGAQALGASERA